MTLQPLGGISQSPLTDEDIARKVVSGETALYEVLMRRHNERLYRTVRGILKDEGEAEDAMQQTYIDAWRSLASFEGRSAFSTWLTRIAIREAWRRRERAARRGEDELAERWAAVLESPGPGPEEDAMAIEGRAILEREIDSLPEAYRVVVMLREVEGLSTAETAEVLDLRQDAVKTRLSRARAMLRSRLGQDRAADLAGSFSFQQPRCDRIVAAVFESMFE